MKNTITLKGKELKLEDTKVIKYQYNRYLRSDEYDIWDAYKQPSRRKEAAWEACIKDCEEHGGYGLKVAGHNTTTFSAGFLFKDDACQEIYCHITPYYDRYMLVR